MKMLFFSSDGSEIELLHRELAHAGIPCRVCNASPQTHVSFDDPCAALWIENDEDSHKAATLCVRLGVGFDTREIRRSARLWTDLDDQILQESCSPAG